MGLDSAELVCGLSLLCVYCDDWLARCGVVWCGMAWHGVAWHGVAWHGVVCDIIKHAQANSRLVATDKHF